MANWYHCSVKPVSRGAGRSCVAAAAYRIGERLHDERTQTTHDYTRKTGVEASFTIAPAHAPEWASDPAHLWNASEAAENRVNSRTAREVELALPSEVGRHGREEIARGIAEDLVNRYGVAVMVALHEPSKHGDDRNYHAHILFTTRRMEADGLGKKTRELDDQTQGKAEVLHIREYAADLINAGLKKVGNDNFIDHRSFKDRGIEQTPTKHLSLQALAMEKRGEGSDQGDRHRETKQANQRKTALARESEELDRQIEQARAEILEFKLKPELEPTLEVKAKEKPETYWQDKILAERKGDNEGDSEGGNRPADPPSAEIEETSAINNHVTIAHAQQIATQGEIQHQGLKKSWVEHALNWAHDLGEDIADTWQMVKEEIKGGSDRDLTDRVESAEQKPSAVVQEMGEAETATIQNPKRDDIEAKPAEIIEPQEHKPSFWQRFIGKGKTPDITEATQQKPIIAAECENKPIEPQSGGQAMDYLRSMRDKPKPAYHPQPQSAAEHLQSLRDKPKPEIMDKFAKSAKDIKPNHDNDIDR